MDIGFIGTGRMGSAMALNLIEAGHAVRAWDTAPDRLSALAAAGATVAQSAADAFRGDAVLSMLPNDEAMRTVFLDGPGAADGAGAPIHVNMATASVEIARDLTAHHAARGAAYVAATVFGRPDVAAAAKLSIIAAGDPQAIATVRPLFEVLGQRTFEVGAEPYLANVVKLAGNLLVVSAIEGLGEAAAMVRAHGMAAPEVLGAIVTSLFDVPVYRGYAEMIGAERYEPPGFDLVLGLKDVRLALAAAEERDVPLPFASVLRDSFLDAIANGDGAKDWSAIARVAARRAGLERS